MNYLTWGGVSRVLWVSWHHAMRHAVGWWPGRLILPGDGPCKKPPLRFLAAPSGAATMTGDGPWGGSCMLVTKSRHNEAPERVRRGSNRSFWRGQGAGVAHSAGQWVGRKTSEHSALVSCTVRLAAGGKRVNPGFYAGPGFVPEGQTQKRKCLGWLGKTDNPAISPGI